MRRHGGRNEAGTYEAETYEAEVLPGLVPFARDELASTGRARPTPPTEDEATADALPFAWSGKPAALARLRTVTSVQRVLRFDVPRPKALLGDAQLRRLSDAVREVIAASEAPFHGVRVEAAGSDSAVMQRLRAALADAAGLPDDPHDGDLQVRVRPAPGGARDGGWQVLIRLTPRPLSARHWRVRNLPGGLNACVAAAAWRWLGHDRDQRVANLMCGSGTLLIERARLGPAARLVGVDRDPAALEATRANAAAAGLPTRDLREAVATDATAEGAPDGAPSATSTATSTAPTGATTGATTGRSGARSHTASHAPAPTPERTLELLLGDAAATPFPVASFDVVVVDPPWGDAVGNVAGLERLYLDLLREAARVTAPGGVALVVTHALRAFDAAAAGVADAWSDDGAFRVFHGGHRPVVRRLARRDDDRSSPRV